MLGAELAERAILITARYALAIKSDEDEEERYKTRYVAGRHLDIHKDFIVHGAQTIQCVSVRIILVVAKIKRFRIWVVDVQLAYLKSDKPLIRKIFITNLAPDFVLSPEECLEPLKLIYSLAD